MKRSTIAALVLAGMVLISVGYYFSIQSDHIAKPFIQILTFVQYFSVFSFTLFGASGWIVKVGYKGIYPVLGLIDLFYLANYSFCDTAGLEGRARCYAGSFSPILEQSASLFAMSGWFPPVTVLLLAPALYTLYYPIKDIRSCYRQYREEQNTSGWFGFLGRFRTWCPILFLLFQLSLLVFIIPANDFKAQRAQERKSAIVTKNLIFVNATSELHRRVGNLLQRENWSILQTVTTGGSDTTWNRVVVIDGKVLRRDDPEGVSYINKFGKYYLVGEGGKDPFQVSEYASGTIYFYSGNGTFGVAKIIPQKLEKASHINILLDDLAFLKKRLAEDFDKLSSTRQGWTKINESSFHFQSPFYGDQYPPTQYSQVDFENETTDHPQMTLVTFDGGASVQLDFSAVLDIDEALRFPFGATEVKE